VNRRCLTGALTGDYYAHEKETHTMQRKTRLGRPPKPARLRKTRRLQLLLSPAEHKRLSQYARERDVTVSELIRSYVRSLMEPAGGSN